MKTKSLTDALLPTLAAWPIEDLRDLQESINALVEAIAPPVDEQEESTAPEVSAGAAPTGGGGKARARGAGYIEEKMVNGCGPYRYLRWRSEGRQRSRYIGKAPKVGG